MHCDNHKGVISADSMCQDSIVGGNVGPLTSDGFNIFMNQNKDDKKTYSTATGCRSTPGYHIDREHSDKLFNVPMLQIAPWFDHGITRITEHLLTLLVAEIHR